MNERDYLASISSVSKWRNWALPSLLRNCPHSLVMVDPTSFFWHCPGRWDFGLSLLLAVCKVLKTVENFHALSPREKGFGYQGSHLCSFIPGFLCPGGGDFTCHHGIGDQSIYGEKFDDENFSWSAGVLASCPWQILDPAQMGSSFSFALPRLSGWMANMWSLARWKRPWTLWKHGLFLGPEMARPARRSPQLTVDKSNTFFLCCILTTRSSLL